MVDPGTALTAASVAKDLRQEIYSKVTLRKVIITIIVMIVFIILLKNRYVIANLFKTKAPNVGVEEQLATPVLESRKPVIHAIGQDLKTDIYYTSWWGHYYEAYNKALSLADNELKYLATYYKQNLSIPLGRTLYSDIDSQWYTWSDAPEQLMNKLATVGER